MDLEKDYRTEISGEDGRWLCREDIFADHLFFLAQELFILGEHCLPLGSDPEAAVLSYSPQAFFSKTKLVAGRTIFGEAAPIQGWQWWSRAAGTASFEMTRC